MRKASLVSIALGMIFFSPAAMASGITFYDQEVPAVTNSVIYVVDLSGSMNGGRSEFIGLDGQLTTGSKLDRAKVELIRSVQALSEDTEFNLIAYDCTLRRWAQSRQRAEPASKASAVSWVGALRPSGATGTGPAVASALGDKNNFTIVLLSDGAPNCIGSSWVDEFGSGDGVIGAHLAMIQASNTQRAAIHCFGIQAYGEFERFLRDVATASGGRYHPIN